MRARGKVQKIQHLSQSEDSLETVAIIPVATKLQLLISSSVLALLTVDSEFFDRWLAWGDSIPLPEIQLYK